MRVRPFRKTPVYGGRAGRISRPARSKEIPDDPTSARARPEDVGPAEGDAAPWAAVGLRLLQSDRADHLLRAGGQGGLLRRGTSQQLRMQVIASSAPDTAPFQPPVEVLSREFRERLQAFVARRVSNLADVDDIVQWVFLRMHQNLGQIRHYDRIHAWLYSTARRAIADYYRSGTRREAAAGSTVDLEGLHARWQSPSGVDEDSRPEVAACLAPVMDRLGASDQEAIRLTDLQGVSVAEAAARAGISLSGMKSRVQRARLRLRRAILDCCRVALDGRGAPMSCAKREPVAAACCPKPES